MTEASQEIVLGASSGAPASMDATPGVLLAAARQRLGWSVGDVAAKLRMSVQQVDALEQADYSRLPTGTFLRGFVRSYAKLVALAPDQVLKALEETHPDGRRPTIVVPTQNIALTVPGERYSTARTRGLLIAALFLALAGGGAYWWLHIRPDTGRLADRAAQKSEPVAIALPTPPAPPQTAENAATLPANAATAPANPAEAGNLSGAAPSAVPSQPVSGAQPAAPTPQPEPQPAALTQTTAPLASPAGQEKPVVVPKGSGSLKFSFTGECWVEVTEASGKTLLSRRFKAGETDAVIGKLPLSVAIGNAPVTKLKYNEVDFDLAPHTRVAVARFTLK